MNQIFRIAAFVVASSPAFAANVGMSVSVGQPGFYGQIDIGGYPPPPVIYRQPIMVEPVIVDRPPIYLRVPPGHAKNWGKHCHQYHACGERVFFVQDAWYNREYAPRYRNDYRAQEDFRGDGRREHPGHGHGHRHERD